MISSFGSFRLLQLENLQSSGLLAASCCASASGNHRVVFEVE
jgi:hypothetical protein